VSASASAQPSQEAKMTHTIAQSSSDKGKKGSFMNDNPLGENDNEKVE